MLGYSIKNLEKWDRALHGNGREYKGVGDDAKDFVKLAEYDKLGGLIMKGNEVVKMGSFYNFKEKKPRDKAKVIFIYRDECDVVEVPEGKAVPTVLKAKAEIKKARLAKKVKKQKEDEKAKKEKAKQREKARALAEEKD